MTTAFICDDDEQLREYDPLGYWNKRAMKAEARIKELEDDKIKLEKCLTQMSREQRSLTKKYESKLEAVTKWNHSVAVCKDHTDAIVAFCGCVICTIDELTATMSVKNERIWCLEHTIATLQVGSIKESK
jgi:hypothetical protein